MFSFKKPGEVLNLNGDFAIVIKVEQDYFTLRTRYVCRWENDRLNVPFTVWA